MIRKEFMEKPRCAFYWVENILTENKEYYLSRDEIYDRIPRDEDGAIVTISAMDNALRNLEKMGHINVEYHLGRKYYNYREERKKYG